MERSPKKSRPSASSVPIPPPRPDVIIDFVFEVGVFFISIKNIGDAPALNVTTSFNTAFSGLGGTQDTSSLPVFRSITFLAPDKEIRTMLDTSTSYFQRKQPTTIRATVSYRDRMNNTYSDVITHDLDIYKDIAYIPPAENSRQSNSTEV